MNQIKNEAEGLHGQQNLYESFESESPDGSVRLWGVRSTLKPSTPKEWRGQEVVAGTLYDAMFAEATARRLAELCNHFPESNWDTHSELLLAEGFDMSEPCENVENRKLTESGTLAGKEQKDMSYTATDEARSIVTGYVSKHPDLEPALTDAAAWRHAAELELKARDLGVVKAMSGDTLKAIAKGEIDMPAIYASARKGHGKG